MNNFIDNLKQYSSYDFTDEQLKIFKSSVADLYRVLKKVFDKPKRNNRPFTSVEMYKMKRDRVMRYPDEFYKFDNDNIVILVCRKRSYYCVGVSGFSADNFRDIKIELDSTEKEFSCGFSYYGHFEITSQGLISARLLFHKILFSYLRNTYIYDDFVEIFKNV